MNIYMNKYIMSYNIFITLIIFVSIYSVIILMEPNFIYNNDGSLRQFGVGFKKRTVIPLWLISIILAILSYFTVRQMITYDFI